MMTRNLPRFISRDFSAATPARLILKDLGIIHEEAKGAQVPAAARRTRGAAISRGVCPGLAEEDMAPLVKLWRSPPA